MDQEKIDQFNKARQEKEKEQQQMGAINSIAQSVISAVKNGSTAQISTIEKSMDSVAKSEDIQEVIQQLKEAQLATYLSASSKQPVILADSTDLGSAVNQLGSKLDTLINLLGEDDDTEESLDSDILNAIKELKGAISGIDVKPVVNVPDPVVNVSVPEPVVNVDIPKTDLTPLSKDIKSVVAAVKSIKQPTFDTQSIIEASDRVAQSVNNLTFPVPNFVQDPFIRYKPVDEYDDGNSSNVKYYGFLDPEGHWYIMKYDPSASAKTMRYAFGGANYATNWTNRASLNYDLPFIGQP